MMGFAMIGYLVVAAALAVGIYWMVTNLTFKSKVKEDSDEEAK